MSDSDAVDADGDQHGDRAIYCEEAEQYILGRTEDGECPRCGADLTGERMDDLEETLDDHGVSTDV